MRISATIMQCYSRKSISKYFPNPLVQNKYPVIPPPKVPAHIIKPPYVNNKNAQFGIYQGIPRIHSSTNIQKMKKAATVASLTLQATKDFIERKGKQQQPLTQEQIDNFVFNHIIAQNAYPTPIGFMHFPKSVCISVNQCFVHGIPSTRPLQLGDKLNIDVTAYIDGHHGDNNLTIFYGQARHQVMANIAAVTLQSLYAAISICRPGAPFNLVGRTIESVVKRHGFHVCEQFSGHGIGQLLHMPPMVFHRYYPGFTELMQAGQTFTIEPIITLNPLTNIKIWKDNFTSISDNNPNAQFQHTILIVEQGCEVITKRKSQVIPNPNNNIVNA